MAYARHTTVLLWITLCLWSAGCDSKPPLDSTSSPLDTTLSPLDSTSAIDDLTTLHYGAPLVVTIELEGISALVIKSTYDWSLIDSEKFVTRTVDTTLGFSFLRWVGQDSVTELVRLSAGKNDSIMVESGNFLMGDPAYRVNVSYELDTSANVLKNLRIFRGVYRRYLGSTIERSDTDLIVFSRVPVKFRNTDSLLAAIDLDTDQGTIHEFLYSRYDGYGHTQSYTNSHRENLVSLKETAACKMKLAIKFKRK